MNQWEPPHDPYGQRQQYEKQHNPYAAPYAAPPVVAVSGGCQVCGAQVPTRHVNLLQNIGLIAIRFHKQTTGHLCRACIRDIGWSYTLTTGFLGWWGVISFFFTLFILPTNVWQMFAARSLPEVPGRARPKGPYVIITILGAILSLFTAMVLLGAVISLAEDGLSDPGPTIGALVAVFLFGVVPAGLMLYFGIRGLAAKPTV